MHGLPNLKGKYCYSREVLDIFTVIVCYTAVAAVTFLVTMASQENKINICPPTQQEGI